MTWTRRSRVRDGRTLAWLEAGAGPDTLVLLHAVGLDGSWWMPHLDALLDAVRARTRVLAIDMPGHGGSDPLPEVTLEGIARELLDVVAPGADQLDGTPSDREGVRTVVGVSMGGMVAQHLASQSDAVDRLVLVATAASFPDAARAAIRARAAVAREEGAPALADQTIGRWFDPGLLTGAHPIVERARAELARLDAEQHARCWEAIAALDTRDALGAVRARSLVLAGEADTSVPLDRCRELADALPDADLEVVPSGAHLFAFERTDWLAPALERLASRSTS